MAEPETPEEKPDPVRAAHDSIIELLARGLAGTLDEQFAGSDENLHQLRRRLAGILLHGQPYGFTRQDVELLRRIYDMIVRDDRRAADELATLASRVEALLPSEKR